MFLNLDTLFTWGGSLFSRFLSDTALKFAALKAMFYSFVTVTLPVVLKNLFTWLFGVLTSQLDQLDFGSMSSAVIEFTGVAAWFAVHLRFLDCLAVLVTALTIRLILNFIPFVG